MNKRNLFLALALFGLAPLVAIHAHSVWIEDNDAQQLVVRFGQVGPPPATSTTSTSTPRGLPMPTANSTRSQ